MHKPLIGEKLAVLVANGFNESDLTHLQKAIIPLGANVRIISMDHGLVNAWRDDSWGLHFASDKALASALAADFSMLVVPGGRRSIEKLKLTAHTRRFISGFIDTNKPVAMFGEALELLAFAEKAEGRTIAATGATANMLSKAGAHVTSEAYEVDEMLMTGGFNSADMKEYVNAIAAFFAHSSDIKVAA